MRKITGGFEHHDIAEYTPEELAAMAAAQNHVWNKALAAKQTFTPTEVYRRIANAKAKYGEIIRPHCEIGHNPNANGMANQKIHNLKPAVRQDNELIPGVDYGSIQSLILPQPKLSTTARTWYEHRLALAERIYKEMLLRHGLTGQTGDWCEGNNPLDYYFIEHNFFGIGPEDCRCVDGDICHTCGHWQNEAVDILYTVIDGFTPPNKPLKVEPRLPVKLHVPNIIVVNVIVEENCNWRFHADPYRPPSFYRTPRKRP